MAQSAVSAIRTGCEMLQQGRAVIDEFKGEAEGVVGQVQETVETIAGLWDWARGLWASVTGKSAEAPAVSVNSAVAIAPIVRKKKQRSPEPDSDILQMQTVHDVSQNLGKFFDLQQQITNYYKDLEEESLHVYEADQNHAMKAIERVEVELQMEEMTVKIREMMVYAPRELKDLYTRFLQMYGRIKDEQEFARQEQVAKVRYQKAQKWQQQNKQIDLAIWVAGMAVVLSVYWWTMVQVATLSGFSMACCFLP